MLKEAEETWALLWWRFVELCCDSHEGEITGMKDLWQGLQLEMRILSQD
jgi:hypothetical protein